MGARARSTETAAAYTFRNVIQSFIGNCCGENDGIIHLLAAVCLMKLDYANVRWAFVIVVIMGESR